MDDLLDLDFRKRICIKAIEILRLYPDDPKQPEALDYYQKQLEEIERRIIAIKGKPEDIVIGLKTAVLFPRVER